MGRSAVSLKDAWRHVERSRWKNLREAPREEGDPFDRYCFRQGRASACQKFQKNDVLVDDFEIFIILKCTNRLLLGSFSEGARQRAM